MNDELPPNIGACEWCGVVSHHLDHGECPACRELTCNLPLWIEARPLPPEFPGREEPLSFEL